MNGRVQLRLHWHGRRAGAISIIDTAILVFVVTAMTLLWHNNSVRQLQEDRFQAMNQEVHQIEAAASEFWLASIRDWVHTAGPAVDITAELLTAINDNAAYNTAEKQELRTIVNNNIANLDGGASEALQTLNAGSWTVTGGTPTQNELNLTRIRQEILQLAQVCDWNPPETLWPENMQALVTATPAYLSGYNLTTPLSKVTAQPVVFVRDASTPNQLQISYRVNTTVDSLGVAERLAYVYQGSADTVVGMVNMRDITFTVHRPLLPPSRTAVDQIVMNNCPAAFLTDGSRALLADIDADNQNIARVGGISFTDPANPADAPVLSVQGSRGVGGTGNLSMEFTGTVNIGTLQVADLQFLSDPALKNNIAKMSPGWSLEMLEKAQTYRWVWKDSGKSQVGFLATDFAELADDVLVDEPGNPLRLDMNGILALLWDQNQQQQKAIQQLQEDLAALPVPACEGCEDGEGDAE